MAILYSIIYFESVSTIAINILTIYLSRTLISIRRFTVELSPNNPEPKHTPDSFVFTCTTHIVEELHKNSELNHEAIFCVENVPISVYKFNIH